MKTGGTPHSYISGPHASDYYLLQDEESACIFATRLAERAREASGIGLLEMWIDDTGKRVWYVFAR